MSMLSPLLPSYNRFDSDGSHSSRACRLRLGSCLGNVHSTEESRQASRCDREKDHVDRVSLANYFAASTTATLFTPLHARYSRPLGVATMLRITPPPDGISLLLKVSDWGSNRTSVLGFTPDSLYQTTPLFVIAIPYGSDSSPPGDAHSFTNFPSPGSKCPRY